MFSFGHVGGVFLIYAIVASSAACLCFIWDKISKGCFARYCVYFQYFQALCLGIACIFLFYAVYSNDFSLIYVANYSDITLPILYKISVLWSGIAGFLLFLTIFFSLASLFAMWRIKDKSGGYYRVFSLLSSVFFLIFCIFIVFMANPFTGMDFVPVNGAGLDPLLQTVPLFLYACFKIIASSLYFIIFLWAFASIILKDYGVYWVQSSIKYVYVAVIVAALVLFFSGISSVYTISNKGFLAWNTADTANIIIFIITVALLHFMKRCLNNGRKKRITLILALLVFEFNLLSLIYSGVIDGSIAYIEKTRITAYLSFPALLSCLIFSYFFIKGYKRLRSVSPITLRPNEVGVNIIGGIIFFAAFFLFIGLILEIYEAGSGGKAIYSQLYNYYVIAVAILSAVILTLFLIMKLLIGKNYEITAKYVLIFITIFIVIGIFLDYLFKINVVVSIFVTMTASTILLMLVYVFKTALRRKGYSFFTNKVFIRMLIHIGFLIVILGVVLSLSGYKKTYIGTAVNKNFVVGGYNFLVRETNSLYKNNYLYTFVNISVNKNGRKLGEISPEIRNYNNSRKLYAEIESKRSFLTVLTVAFISYDFKNADIELFVAEYPNILLIPIGVIIIIAGILFTAFRKRNFNE